MIEVRSSIPASITTGSLTFADYHIHTNLSDGLLSPAEVIILAEEIGFLHIIGITDHNSVRGALEVWNCAQRRGSNLQVLIGEEVTTSDGHLLALNIESDIASGRSAEYTIDKIHSQGGFAVVPHPTFPKAHSLSEEKIRQLAASENVYLDGFEIANGGVHLLRSPANQRAEALYDELGGRLGVALGGSDGHKCTLATCFTAFEGSDFFSILAAVRGTRVMMLDNQELLQLAEKAIKIFPQYEQEIRKREERYHRRAKRGSTDL